MNGDRSTLRFPMACMALLLAPLGAAEAKELKPKFGDIGGVFYTEVSGDREACEQAIKNKIALCRQNTSFVSNTLDRKYPGCLPIFREQSRGCADHFRSEPGRSQRRSATHRRSHARTFPADHDASLRPCRRP